MEPGIHGILQVLGIHARWADMLAALAARVDVPLVAVQGALILVFGLIGAWLAPRGRHFANQMIGHTVPKAWAPGLRQAFQSVAAPLFWLLTLWVADAVGESLGFRLGLVGAAVSLLMAWVTIRVLSFAVSNPVWSATISFAAWTVAALSILGLLGPLTHQLDAVGFVLGKLRISALTVVRAVLVLGVLLWLTKLASTFLEKRITKAEALTPSLQALLIRILNLALPALAVLIALDVVGVDLTALTVFSGAVGIGVGLGLQRTIANLVAGITLIVGKSIKPGDVVAYKDTYGWVTHMGARYVAIATRDGSEYLVPNEYFITNGVENWSYSSPNMRVHVPVGVAYGTDLHQAIALCIAAANAVPRVLAFPEPVCLVTGFGDSSVNLEIRAWISDPKNGIASVKSAVMLEVWDRFAEAGITLPFPQRDVHLIPPPSAAGSNGP
ncbi:MAG: mechanosensitive ion channel [Alphaproteobacteria bacterium]|nr:mechanosensitive ion channel [Alphaproteobacteria bacterium]MDE2013091.1 mechanosensitive ion channel [Alphaproteobacteria bacterium]MDE2351312.1 mechanosensitive ion channel [Alphaproteobacteria bacterium]